ncbi:branched-chain amino acid ABC transporter permease [Xaviernesmea oryzae]|uniref:Branched-chain amino acid ABC transporter permease n=1 Tax=Xaviernesmea oryzae TaxID=464029 RepID=A0A1Q9ARG4_9HYPH|nr:ABC transporter permease [Xaviernesmea oryzae]OLP57956.1 branched-chain amino acid ABC transporter permease [Xaviernesmea oryzae]SEL29109.1 rhamnose ABC transporter membrane protein [Xaviernesmea oryzae]
MARFLKRRETLLFLIIALMVAGFATRAAGFASPDNLGRIFNDTAILIILALAQMVVILTKAIDLSVAANLAFTGMAIAMVNAAFPAVPLPVLVLAAIAIGAALGAINGFLVWRLEIPPIVVTLGTLTIYRGMAFVLSGGAWVNAHQMTPTFLDVPRSVVLGLPVLSWCAIAVVVFIAALLRYSPFGRAAYAAGGNPVAAVYAGINVGRTRYLAFVLSGALAGLSSYLWVSRYAVAYVDIANGFELDSVAACVIGGVAIAGGVGTVVGTVLGALFLGVIKNALPVIGISPFTQMAISGSVIILAVLFNARRERTRGRIILRDRAAAPRSQELAA